MVSKSLKHLHPQENEDNQNSLKNKKNHARKVCHKFFFRLVFINKSGISRTITHIRKLDIFQSSLGYRTVKGA